jgi:uncharacterized protein (UPF0332 family)
MQIIETDAEAYLLKANECLAGAQNQLAAGRFNNSANRSYYACFQAAIAALIRQGVKAGRDGEWPHKTVQALFASHYINRRKRIAPEFRTTLPRAFALRQIADYDVDEVGELPATRMMRQAVAFVAAIEQELSR